MYAVLKRPSAAEGGEVAGEAASSGLVLGCIFGWWQQDGVGKQITPLLHLQKAARLIVKNLLLMRPGFISSAETSLVTASDKSPTSFHPSTVASENKELREADPMGNKKKKKNRTQNSKSPGCAPEH